MNKKAAEQQRAVRSMETPEQYSEFEDSVIEAAKTQAQRIIDDARRQGDANFDKLMEGHRGDPLIPYREEAKNRLARKMASVKQDNRKKLLVYRSQLVNGLFAEMEEALEEYTGTPAYAQRVADALARRAPEISGKCTVRLRRADEALLAPVVTKALPSADIAVDGSIQTRTYEDKTGNKRYAFEVVANNVHFTGEKSGSTGGQGGYGAPAPMQAPAARPAPAEPVSYAAGSADDFAVIDDNEDLPF